MAITKKAILIQQQKNELVSALIKTRIDINEACGKVPKIVIDGSAQLAVAWRTKAENELGKPPALSGTLDEMKDRLQEYKKTATFLQTGIA